MTFFPGIHHKDACRINQEYRNLRAYVESRGLTRNDVTQLMMRLDNSLDPDATTRNMTTGEIVEGKALLDAVKMGYSIAREQIEPDGNVTQILVTRESAPGTIDFDRDAPMRYLREKYKKAAETKNTPCI